MSCESKENWFNWLIATFERYQLKIRILKCFFKFKFLGFFVLFLLVGLLRKLPNADKVSWHVGVVSIFLVAFSSFFVRPRLHCFTWGDRSSHGPSVFLSRFYTSRTGKTPRISTCFPLMPLNLSKPLRTQPCSVRWGLVLSNVQPHTSSRTAELLTTWNSFSVFGGTALGLVQG